MTSNTVICYFDFETTGLNHPTQQGVGIVSIGAIFGNKKFHRFMLPMYPITAKASEIHGIVKDGDNLLLNGTPIDDVSSPKDGIRAFFRFIRKNSDGYSKVILCAHNCFGYDKKVLENHLQELDIDMPPLSFSDSMTLAKEYKARGVYVYILT